MKSWRPLVEGSAGVLLVCGVVWAQPRLLGQVQQGAGSSSSQSSSVQSPATPANPITTENPAASSASTSDQTSMAKQKHWSGALVDASCIAKTIGAVPAKGSGTAAGSGATGAETPHFSSQNPDQFQQAGSQPGGMGPAGATGSRNPVGTSPSYPGAESGQNPDMSQAQSARAAVAQRVDTAAKQCSAGSSTQQFGLATSEGDVLRLDQAGNAKASEALRSVDVQPGKKVKAKVTGVMEANNVVQVASVEVKGKKISPSTSMAGPGGTGEVK